MAVSNTGPLIWLAKAGLLDLLWDLYGNITVPPTVIDEAVMKGIDQGHREAGEILRAIERHGVKAQKPVDSTLLRVKAAQERLKLRTDPGEEEAIALAIDRGETLLTNDRTAYALALSLGVEAFGLVYILIRAVKEGRLEKGEAVKALVTMMENGMWLSPKIVIRFQQTIDRL